jgi:cyclopropane fatty-acyl-phospholipid synthase-like methyltransferase
MLYKKTCFCWLPWLLHFGILCDYRPANSADESQALALQAVASQESPAATASTVEPDRPQNLPQGINDSFLDPNMDPDEFVKRFEVESREVFACRFQIMDALELSPGDAVADIGAGTGLFMNALSKKVGSDGKVFAVEIAPSFVRHLRQRAKEEHLDNVEIVFCSDRDANLAKESVDRILICDVYHHFEYPRLTMQSLWRALKPGGMLVLIDFHPEPENVSPDRTEWLKGHVRAPMEVFRQEIEEVGFLFKDQVDIDGFKENYLLRFIKL